MTMELRCPLTPSPIPSALAQRVHRRPTPWEKPSFLLALRHLPLALSTVQWRGQLEAGHAQQLPKHVGAHGWAVEPQEACQSEGRGRFRLGQGLAMQVPLPSAWQQAAHP